MVKPITEAETTAVCNTAVVPHPDGQPWPKCCGDKKTEQSQCTCLMRKPRYGRPRYAIIMDMLARPRTYGITSDQEPAITSGKALERLQSEGGRFFCVHRMDGKYHRECAGWAAKFNKKGNCDVAVCETGISVDCAASGQAGHVDSKGKGIGRYFKLFSGRQNP